MTIAACYLSSEGVVLGADSTSTLYVSGPSAAVAGGLHHLNYAQKIFEIGEHSTLGITMWGMGSVGDLSHRTIIARFADQLVNNPVHSVQEAAERFAGFFWTEYTTRLAAAIAAFASLHANPSRTPDEEENYEDLSSGLSGGFCIGGHIPENREPGASEIVYSPELLAAPVPTPLNRGNTSFWGCPSFMNRLMYGIDFGSLGDILASKKWGGTDQELYDIILARRLAQPSSLPLREAVDWIHAVIYTTIKAMKFSHHLPICGGPIEIAVMSSDRRFRWVKHKNFDEALR